jgi:hypothetical protein
MPHGPPSDPVAQGDTRFGRQSGDQHRAAYVTRRDRDHLHLPCVFVQLLGRIPQTIKRERANEAGPPFSEHSPTPFRFVLDETSIKRDDGEVILNVASVLVPPLFVIKG